MMGVQAACPMGACSDSRQFSETVKAAGVGIAWSMLYPEAGSLVSFVSIMTDLLTQTCTLTELQV